MGKPDALSQCADHSSGQSDNDNMTLLTPDLFHIHALSAINIVGPKKKILTDIQNSLREDVQEESVAKAAQELQKDPIHGTIHSAEWSKVQGLLTFRGKIYVPND